MLRGLLELKDAVSLLTNQTGMTVGSLGQDEWTAMEEAVEVLKPLYHSRVIGRKVCNRLENDSSDQALDDYLHARRK